MPHILLTSDLIAGSVAPCVPTHRARVESAPYCVLVVIVAPAVPDLHVLRPPLRVTLMVVNSASVTSVLSSHLGLQAGLPPPPTHPDVLLRHGLRLVPGAPGQRGSVT